MIHVTLCGQIFVIVISNVKIEISCFVHVSLQYIFDEIESRIPFQISKCVRDLNVLIGINVSIDKQISAFLIFVDNNFSARGINLRQLLES